jgi:hypothetical protein
MRIIGVAAAVAVTFFSLHDAAFGQLTDDDIAVLKARAKSEGWTFTVR